MGDPAPSRENSESHSIPGERTDASVKVFLGQISRTASEEEIRPLLEPHGDVQELAIVRDRVTGASRGCAFAVFSDQAGANRAINALHGKEMMPNMTRAIQCRLANGEQERLENKLFVGMVARTATEADLMALFSRFGHVEQLHILRDWNTQESKGCAFLRFRSRPEALAAIEAMHLRHQMEGSTAPLVVKFADAKKSRPWDPSSVGGAGGQQQPYAWQSGFAVQQWSHFQHVMPHCLSFHGQQPLPWPPGPHPHDKSEGEGSSAFVHPGLPPELVATMGVGMPPIGYPIPQFPFAPQFVHPPPFFDDACSKQGPPGANLFVYHLPPYFSDVDMANLFSQFGSLVSSKVYIDRLTGESKGFGFVSFASPDSAEAAIESMNGYQIGAKRLKVQHKRGHLEERQRQLAAAAAQQQQQDESQGTSTSLTDTEDHGTYADETSSATSSTCLAHGGTD